MNITGVKVNYYFICKTKLWLFSHNIQMEKENENVQLGKFIHESRYKRAQKDIIIDNTISIDFVKKGDILEVHDIKKSRKMKESHKWQLIYYLYYLYQRGVDAIGVLNYPLLNKKETIIPDKKDFENMKNIISNIKNIISGDIPSPVKRGICKKCSYFEFCFGGEE